MSSDTAPPGGAAARVEQAEALRANGIGCFEWEPASGRFTLDDNGLAVFDLLPEEYNGHADDLGQRIPEDEAARLTALVADIVAGRADSYSTYFRIRLRGGGTRWTHTQGQVVRVPAYGAIRVVGVLRDATQELSHSSLRLLAESDRRRQEDAMREVAHALAEAMSVADVVDVLTGDQSMRRLGTQGVSLGVVEQGRIRLVAAVGTTNAQVKELQRARLAEPWPLNDAVRSGEPLFFTSVEAFIGRYPRLARYVAGTRATAAAFLPLIAQGRAIGAMSMVYEGKRSFSAEDRTLLTAWSSAIAQSLQRAMLLDRSREIAAGLQNVMLPRHIPDVPGGRIAVRYRTAREGIWIGGDWYDAVLLADRSVGLAIGDVQGHDTEAAAIMGQLRIAMTAYAREGHPCESVLAKASAFLAEMDAERFATCLYMHVVPATGTVRAANAGHLPPLVRHAGGTVTWWEVAGGPPLGLPVEWGAAVYPHRRFHLRPGDTVVLYSDGLVERPGEDLDQGLARLASVLSAGPADLDALADHLRDSLTERIDAEDDAALLMLQLDGSPDA
ncbi:magnesium or manganese-dependent protein phosphatase [Kitasatospora sp. NE20-6]|uniref:SpoIIE family protein phosphatase n=1 Tax=Kitasatospora sp. NE20-6 TaxID=2859066 RepID=UPI0034DBE710